MWRRRHLQASQGRLGAARRRRRRGRVVVVLGKRKVHVDVEVRHHAQNRQRAHQEERAEVFHALPRQHRPRLCRSHSTAALGCCQIVQRAKRRDCQVPARTFLSTHQPCGWGVLALRNCLWERLPQARAAVISRRTSRERVDVVHLGRAAALYSVVACVQNRAAACMVTDTAHIT